MTTVDVAQADLLLSTTRAVRKRLDLQRPVELGLVHDALRVALQAPTGGNLQGWRFLVVTDPQRRAAIAEQYLDAWNVYSSGPQPTFRDGDPRAASADQVLDSAQYLADHLAEVPVLVIPCLRFRPEGVPFFAVGTLLASILPATWSFMLAARARGLGTTMTTLTLMKDREMAAILGLPDGVTHCALIPVAHVTGDPFKPATRLPLSAVVAHDTWDGPAPT